MIAYSDITVEETISEIMIRMGRHRLNTNIDWITMLRYINRAIHEVMVKTLPYKRWAYMSQLVVADGTVLSNKLIGAVRLMISATGDPPYVQARKVDAKEYYEVSDTNRKNMWTGKTNRNPVYTIWGSSATNPTEMVIYITPNTYIGILDCYIVPNDLTSQTDIIPIPYEFRNLVILSALSRVYAKTKDKMLIEEIRKEITEERNKITQLYMDMRMAKKRDLQSFVEPVVPLVEPQPEAGELKQKLY